MESPFQPNASITGIGSLPFVDPRKAIAFVLKYSPAIPFWPQLPRRSAAEHMLLQPFWKFRELLTAPLDGKPPALKRGAAAEFVQALSNESAELVEASAPGFFALVDSLLQRTGAAIAVKGQGVGPVTALRCLVTEGQQLVRYPELVLALADFLGRGALWQITQLQRCGLPVLFFLDEPALFGTEPPAAADRFVLDSALTQTMRRITGADAYAGLHYCGRGRFGDLLQYEASCISLDPALIAGGVNGILREPGLGSLLALGGVLSLGIVPTGPSLRSYSIAVEGDALAAQIASCPEPAITLRRMLITSSCGLALLSEEQAALSFSYAAGLSRRLASTTRE